MPGKHDSRLGRFLGSLDELVRLVTEDSEKGILTRYGEFGDLVKGLRGSYGLTVRHLGAGRSTIAGGGPSRRDPTATDQPGTQACEVREPPIDILDEGERVRVIAEIPGVSETDIVVQLQQNTLVLAATNGDRHYARAIPVPGGLRQQTLRTAYRNGILEISLDRG